MTRVLTVLGTRPEAIKLAPVVREFERRGVEHALVVTGQHREMVDPMLALFGLVPDVDLRVMEPDQTPARVASLVLARLDPVLRERRPDWVVVQGDTTSAAAAALAAFYAGVRVAHVEAGLRTHDKRHPFPEEVNRRVAGVVADLHFAPTAQARRNLRAEGVPDSSIVVTGNPVVDALRWIARRPPTARAQELLATIDGRPLVLVTAHRRESFGAPLENICAALREIAGRRPDTTLLYPVHLNPNVREPVRRLLGGLPNVALTDPLDYATFVALLKRAHVILTDSGGIQEEAPGLGVPVLVLRDVTERPEAVAAGCARLVGTDCARIVEETARLLDAPRRRRIVVSPFGDGHAARRIVATLLGEEVAAFAPRHASASRPTFTRS